MLCACAVNIAAPAAAHPLTAGLPDANRRSATPPPSVATAKPAAAQKKRAWPYHAAYSDVGEE